MLYPSFNCHDQCIRKLSRFQHKSLPLSCLKVQRQIILNAFEIKLKRLKKAFLFTHLKKIKLTSNKKPIRKTDGFTYLNANAIKL